MFLSLLAVYSFCVNLIVHGHRSHPSKDVIGIPAAYRALVGQFVPPLQDRLGLTKIKMREAHNSASEKAKSQQQTHKFSMMTMQYDDFSKNASGRVKTLLPADFHPSEWDVLCGRGKECYNWQGNQRFRSFIDQSLGEYQKAATKLKKSMIVMKIVDAVRMNSPTGTGFVRESRGQWFEIGDEAAREKVGQTIRDALTMQDPQKLARKRMKRAIRNAKRVARRHSPGMSLPYKPLHDAPTSFAATPILTIPSLLPMVSLSEDCPPSAPIPFTSQPPSLHPVVSTGIELPSRASPPAADDNSDEILASIPPVLAYGASREWFRENDSDCGSVSSADLDDIDSIFESNPAVAA